MSTQKIFSGDESREFWDEINSIDNMSTPEDIRWVLYSIGVKLQEFEAKIDTALGGQKNESASKG